MLRMQRLDDDGLHEVSLSEVYGDLDSQLGAMMAELGRGTWEFDYSQATDGEHHTGRHAEFFLLVMRIFAQGGKVYHEMEAFPYQPIEDPASASGEFLSLLQRLSARCYCVLAWSWREIADGLVVDTPVVVPDHSH